MALPFLYGCRKRGLHLSDSVLSTPSSLQPTIGDCPPCGRPRGATLALLDPQEVSISLRSETRIPIVRLTSSGSSVPFMQRAECEPFALGSFFFAPSRNTLYPIRLLPVVDPSPAATACRSRRGEAPEGSSFFSPHVEARSAEDCGKEAQGKNTTPLGCRTYQSDNQYDTLAGSLG